MGLFTFRLKGTDIDQAELFVNSLKQAIAKIR